MNILEKVDEFELNVGPLNIKGKQLLIIGGVVVLVIAGLGGKAALKKHQEVKIAQEQAAREAEIEALSIKGPVALTADQLVDGQYYIKDGDKFYHLIPANLSSQVEGDSLIPAEANSNRLALLSLAEASAVPTLYNDEQLIYYNAGNTATIVNNETGETSTMPSDYWLERFQDQGYTLGFARLVADKSGKIHLKTSEGSGVAPTSSAASVDLSSSQDLIIDAIGGKELTEENISPAGTIKGLVKEQAYKTDIYSGTNYVGGEYIADVQALTSYELYDVTDYSLGNGYTVVTMPTNLQSGYYYVNGVGMMKYVNATKAEGDSNVDYNIPFYITDEEGNVTENPFRASTSQPASSDDSSKTSSKSTDTWNFNISIDNQQAGLDVIVTYADATKSYFDNISTPTASLVAPDGEETDLVNEEGKIMSVSLKDPMLGTWTLKMHGMENKTFTVNTSFSGNTANMIVKNTNNDTTMTVYVDKDLNDGSFVFDWSDKNHAGNFVVQDVNGELICSSDEEGVMTGTYGHSELAVGKIKKGEYKVTLTGESMGSVYFTYKDKAAAKETPEAETATESEAQTDNSVESISDNAVSENSAE